MALFLILLFVFRKKSSNFNRSRLVFLQMACSVSGWMFALLDDSQDVGGADPCSHQGPQASQGQGSAGSNPKSCALQDLPCGNASGCVHKAQTPGRVKEQERNCIAEHRPDCFMSLY